VAAQKERGAAFDSVPVDPGKSRSAVSPLMAPFFDGVVVSVKTASQVFP